MDCHRLASRPLRSLLAAAALAAAGAPADAAGTLAWRGRVDGEVVLEVRGGTVERSDRHDPADQVRSSAPLPEGPVLVYARPVRGRVLVSVDEQPSAGNDYTATLVVRNDSLTASQVEIELVWLESRPGTSGRGWSDDGTWPFGGDGASGSAPPLDWRSSPERPETTPSGRPIDWLRWTGVVDGADYLDIRGSELSVRHLSKLPIQGMDYDRSAPLPLSDLDLSLVKIKGRGDVRMVTDPESANGYTTTVLVDDTDHGGASTYEFELRWERPRGTAITGSGRPLDTLRWRGRVDGRDMLQVRGNRVQIEHLSGRVVVGPEASFSAPLPSRPVVVNLSRQEGRGRVTIEEQPSAANGYTLRLLIDDSKSGADDYDLELSWER